MSFIYVIAGKRGLGKTTLLKSLLENYESSNIIVFDYLSEYDIENFNIAFGLNEINQNILNKKDKYVKLIFRPNKEDNLTIEKSFDKICEIVLLSNNTIFIIEECDNFCSPYYLSEPFRQIIEYGRHQNISIIATTRRLGNLNRSLTAQANKLFTFRQTEKRDLEALNFLGLNINQVKDLDNFKYIEYDL